MDKLFQSLLTELRRGSLTLAVLSQLWDQKYGYSLVQSLDQLGISIEQNTLYPLLRRLEKQGLVTSTWDTSENRPRKYYQLSQYGQEVYHQLKKEWIDQTEKLNKVLNKGDVEDEFS
ncbi:DNA-binding transcriptional regulator, PadR family [Gracilibacillus ureilyticus]|uniref:DNA-binding transcriptional regulator, PadR family n=1 Tax=Gracilibacillus ureilyticus TaxID=531814 RepID=A0A1H9S3Y8_9BACI|nr:PadR family transcriptional regulator [Gracilibacillus ureilyticus]SER79766.1 DNA-binding transcriptional regulator, PadR family [Gracilibacillus ureilyticus]